MSSSSGMGRGFAGGSHKGQVVIVAHGRGRRYLTHRIPTEPFHDGGPAGGSSVLSLVGAVATVPATDQAG